MVKLFNRAKCPKKEQKNSWISVYTSLFSILLCIICLVGTTWAWFSANQKLPVVPIISAKYGISVSVQGGSYTEGQHEGNMWFYTLTPNSSYSITLMTDECTTASTGYCLVTIDDTVYYTSPITAENHFFFTYGTGIEVPDGLTSVQYEELIESTSSTNLSIAWYWGIYPNTQDFVDFEADPGYILLQNGTALGIVPSEAPLNAELILDLTDVFVSETAGLIHLTDDFSLVLTSDEGYKLPEYISVKIDGTIYEVYTDGLEYREIPLNENDEPDITLLPSMPTFSPVTSTLTIPAVLLTEEVQVVEITAAAVEIEYRDCICENKCVELNENCRICKDCIEGCIGNESEDSTDDSTEETDSAEIPDSTEPITTECPVTAEPESIDSSVTTESDFTEPSVVDEFNSTEPFGVTEPEITEVPSVDFAENVDTTEETSVTASPMPDLSENIGSQIITDSTESVTTESIDATQPTTVPAFIDSLENVAATEETSVTAPSVTEPQEVTNSSVASDSTESVAAESIITIEPVVAESIITTEPTTTEAASADSTENVAATEETTIMLPPATDSSVTLESAAVSEAITDSTEE